LYTILSKDINQIKLKDVIYKCNILLHYEN
jgi:hypothetical protein